jgi:peptidoglycan lytic transglycosylase G
VRAVLRAAGAFAVAAVLAAAAFAGWFGYAAYRDRSSPAAPTHVVVEQGSTFADVARQLAAAGAIDNVLSFRLLARLRGQEADVRAGEYRFAAHQTQDEILRALVSGGAQVAVWVAIPEGFTARQIAQRLERDGVGPAGEFERAFERDTIVVGGRRTKNLEGYLFPSTYLVPLGASPSDVERQMTGEFFRQLPADAAARARLLRVTVPQAITVASLIEREAKVEADRPLIAGVIYNRLRLGIPLEVDATIEYALPEHKAVLSFADLKIDSPFNTYTHAGLPPTPIANPGRPSMDAALRPSKTDYLYYVYCGGGHHVFAKTLAAHQANVARCLQ